MKKSIYYITFLSILLLIFICIPVFLQAQPDPNCDPGDPRCPIDGGLVFLLAAGAAYGIKKVRDSRKRDTSAI